MAQYARETKVASAQTRLDIERELMRYGADMFGYTTSRTQAMVQFMLQDHRMRFIIPLPDRRAREFTHTSVRGYLRTQADQDAAYEQAVRQRWRALYLVIKAKLEAVENQISTLEDEFLANIVLGDDQTVGDYLRPRLPQIADTGRMPPMLPERAG